MIIALLVSLIYWIIHIAIYGAIAVIALAIFFTIVNAIKGRKKNE